MLGSGNSLDALSGLLAGEAPNGLGNGSPLSVTYTPAGEIDSAAMELAGARVCAWLSHRRANSVGLQLPSACTRTRPAISAQARSTRAF